MGEPMKAAKNDGGGAAAQKFPDRFDTFEDFYPYYLNEHRNRACKVLHFVGTCLLLSATVGIVLTGHWHLVWLIPVFGYGFAWVGHFGFEKNKPASFKFPFYSLRGDFVMFFDLLTGRLGFAANAELKRN